jgi:hypothetical protein
LNDYTPSDHILYNLGNSCTLLLDGVAWSKTSGAYTAASITASTGLAGGGAILLRGCAINCVDPFYTITGAGMWYIRVEGSNVMDTTGSVTGRLTNRLDINNGNDVPLDLLHGPVTIRGTGNLAALRLINSTLPREYRLQSRDNGNGAFVDVTSGNDVWVVDQVASRLIVGAAFDLVPGANANNDFGKSGTAWRDGWFTRDVTIGGGLKHTGSTLGFYAHTAVVQPAAPVTLADVIAIIRGCGLSA